MGPNFPFCSALRFEVPFKSPEKHLELAMGPHGTQGPHIAGVGTVQPSQLCPCAGLGSVFPGH